MDTGRRVKKDARNFSCRMDAALAARMDEYVRLTRTSKTALVEMALEEYLSAHQEAVLKALAKNAAGD